MATSEKEPALVWSPDLPNSPGFYAVRGKPKHDYLLDLSHDTRSDPRLLDCYIEQCTEAYRLDSNFFTGLKLSEMISWVKQRFDGPVEFAKLVEHSV